MLKKTNTLSFDLTRLVLSGLFKSSTTYPEPGYSSSILRKEAQIALSLAHHEL